MAPTVRLPQILLKFFPQQDSSMRKCLVLYAVLTIITSLVGRVVMTRFFFDYPIVIEMMQMTVTLTVIEFGRMCRVFKLQPYSFQRGKDMFLPSLFYSLSQYVTLNSTDGITLPLFPFIQKFMPILILAIYMIFFRRGRPSILTILFVLLICIGAAFASTYEIMLDPMPTVYSVVTLLLMAIAMARIERLCTDGRVDSPLEIIYMNSFNCLCLLMIADIVQDEMRDAYLYFQASVVPTFVVSLVALIFIGAIAHASLIYALANANALNTSVTYNCASALQVIVAYIISIDAFYDSDPTMFNSIGIFFAIGVTMVYFFSRRDPHLKAGRIEHGTTPHIINKYQMVGQDS